MDACGLLTLQKLQRAYREALEWRLISHGTNVAPTLSARSHRRQDRRRARGGGIT